MPGKKSRSSYKRKRKGTFSGRQRYEKDEAVNVSTTTCESETSQTVEDEDDVQTAIGTSRKKMRGDGRYTESEFTADDGPGDCQSIE